MNRSKPLTIILLFLAGATRLAAQPIPENAVPSMKGKSIVYIRHKMPSFSAETRTNAAATGAIIGLPGVGILAAALVGGVSGASAVASGNKIVNENGIQDPALAVSERLIKNLQTTHAMISLPPPLAPVDVRGVKPLLEQCPGADYILDVQTVNWYLGYFPPSKSLYRVGIVMKASLIEAGSKKIIASGKAERLPKKPDNAPTWDEYLASNAQRLKDDIKKLSEECAEELNLKVFKLPLLPVEAAANPAPTAAAPQVPAPAKSEVPVPPPGLAQTTPAVGPETKPPAGASPVPRGQGAGSPWVDPCSGIEFVWVPEGNFLMGAKRGEADEKPFHHVVLSRGYWMGRYEVTQRQYESVMGMNPAGLRRSGPEAPIETVSWYEAKMYLARLNEKAGQKRYFLPTEAQWEYACWAGTSIFDKQTLSTTAWYAANAGRTTQPVGKLRSNAWGLHDMLGNVWEWCEDWYANRYDPSVLSDPTGPASGANKVARGGSWESYDKLPSEGYLKTWNPTASPYYGVKVVSPTARYPLMPDTHANNLGFRVVAMP